MTNEPIWNQFLTERDKQVFAAERHIVGTRRKGPNPNWSSRAARRLRDLARLTQAQ